MSHIDPYEITNAPNWGALCIAILHRAPVSPETAAMLWEDGKIGRQGVKGGADKTVRMIMDLKNTGLSWSEITLQTGIAAPASIVSHFKRDHSEEWERIVKERCQ